MILVDVSESGVIEKLYSWMAIACTFPRITILDILLT